MSESTEVVVVGAGVVGLAIARALALQGREVIVLEQHRRHGEETSSRNSGVIHSGIYYPRGSLKARMCVRGRGLLYRYCEDRSILHRAVGKLIVAQQEQIPALVRLHETGRANGVADLELIDTTAVRELEPAVQCAQALWSPSTGIVDAAEFMLALRADIEAGGGHVALDCRALSARPAGQYLDLSASDHGNPLDLRCRWLINCAGHNAVAFANSVAGYAPAQPRKAYLAKGNYFRCQGSRPFSHLVYPMPNEAGLGVHATLGLDGTVRFGPDVEWINALDYQVDAARAESFYAEIRRYWPGLADAALQPDYAGIRPKITGPGQAAADFIIEAPQEHGVQGLVNLLGIESPGLTSALALAEEVSRVLQ